MKSTVGIHTCVLLFNRDVWEDKYLGFVKDGFEATVPSHGTRLLKVW